MGGRGERINGGRPGETAGPHPVPCAPDKTAGLHPSSPFLGLARGLQPQIPLLTVAEMSLADILPRHDRPGALAAEPLRHVTQLVGPGGEGVQLPVVRALLALGLQRPKTVEVVAPSWPSLTLCQRLPAFSTEDWAAQEAFPLTALLPVPCTVHC